tara:strand:+ start:630 stop:3659 length:3030 start_codon:yes stop_codon:yes gene_type:complete
MRKFWIIISVCWLWTCGGGGGGSSPTEPQEPAPVANFTATPTTLIQGQAVTFTSTSTGTITSYAWNVDDDPAIEGTTATYSHTYTEVGTYSITLTVTGPGGSNPKTVADMITVSTAAPTPTTSTSQTVQEDGSTTISLTATDPNGQAVTFAITTDPTNGTATLSGTDITYTPNANFYGTDSFDYTASNGTYTSDPVTITVTVEGEDDEPTTNDVSVTTDEDNAVTLTLDATEIDGDNYSFSIVSQPTNGTLGSINGNQVEYTPNENFNGTDTFTFEATDDRTFRRNVATATITVNAVNDAPAANDVTASMDENKIAGRYQPVTITLDATDVDGDALTYFKQSDPTNGTLGSITNNQVVYTPNQDFNGEDTFIYKATDGNADSNGATVTVTVNAVNDAPVTQNVSFTTDEDTPYTESYTAYVSDVDGDDLTIIGVTNPTFGTATCEGTDCTYTPNQDYHGTDSFTYKVNDGELDSNISTVSVTINPVNDAPIANDVTASTTSRMGNMRQSVDITLSVTDADGDDLTISIVSDVSNGTTSLSGSTVTYTPTANYDGTDTFTYKANDGTVDSNIATGTITITDTNQAPIANDMSLSLDRESSIDFTLDASDQDGDSLSKTIVSQPDNGTLVPGAGLNYTYTPDSGYFGTDSFTYKVNDGTSDSDAKTVSFDIDQVVKNLRNNSSFYVTVEKSPQGDNLLLIQKENNLSFLVNFDNNLDVVSTTQFNTNQYFIPGGHSSIDFKKHNNGFISFSNKKITTFDLQMNLLSSIELTLDNMSGRSVEMVENGNILLGGYQWNDESFLIKINSSGDTIWTKTYDLVSNQQDRILGIKQLSDGNYFFVIGLTGKYVKIDQDGEIIWAVNPSDSGTQIPTKIIEHNQLIYIFNDSRQFAILDLNGNLLSSIQIPGFYGAHGTQDMILHSNGDLIMGGIDNNASSGQWNNYLKIVRYDTNGNKIWERQYNEGYPEQNSVIKGIEDSDGNLIFMLRYDETGYTNDKHGIFKVDINDGTKLLP